MSQTVEQFPSQQRPEQEPSSQEEQEEKEYPPFIEKRLQEIEEEVSSLLEKFKEITGKDILEIPDEELANLPLEHISKEDLEKLKELFLKKEKIKKKEWGWHLEGKLTQENILAEYQTGGSVYTANFSPKDDKVVIGSTDNMMRVISLTEKDEEGRPKVLVEYETGGRVFAANFNPEGDKVVIGGEDKMIRVLGQKE